VDSWIVGLLACAALLLCLVLLLLALAELEHNRQIVEAQTERYGLLACVDPAARQALVAAARGLLDHDRQIDALNQRLALAGSDVDLLDGGMPDPSRGSSYHDLMAGQDQFDQANAERAQLRRRYAVQHPITAR
jgi:hypothetical protein